MTTINILLYTDSADIAPVNDERDLRVTMLKSILETKTLAFAEFKLDVINRYHGFDLPESPKIPKKLDKQLLSNYDEVWVFGWYQARVDQDFDVLYGGRDNEFDPDEVQALNDWMVSGGVLISGDHSEHAPKGKDDDPIESFLCLGRALGRNVPRAGQLRKWDGPPTNKSDSSFNTLVRTANPNGGDPQGDAIPQTIILSPVEEDGSPHRIFLGKDTIINIFPDHQHEGELVIPSNLDNSWPPLEPGAIKPKPVVVALGCDKRSCESHPVLAVYDGDNLGVGRIVADTSWHHYFNGNLRGFTDQSAGSVLDLLSQFFHNVALYLAPLHKRRLMREEMIRYLVLLPQVQEERGNSPLKIGRVALRSLYARTTRCEIDELLRTALPSDIKINRADSTSVDSLSTISLLPQPELIVGAIIDRFYRTASAALAVGVTNARLFGKQDEVIREGVEAALDFHAESLRNAVSDI